MQKVLRWLTPAIALGVAVFLVLFLLSINSAPLQEDTQPLEISTQTTKSKPIKTWLNHFYESEKKGYVYPVNEVYVKLDLDEQITKAKTYRLVATLKDPYQQFCLEEELKRHKLKYYLKKDRLGIDLLIYSKNKERLKNLTEVLKNYKIDAQVELYK